MPDVMASSQIVPPERLIFIYNADGGIAQGIMDSIHKTVSPDTYPCSLCAVTYGVFRMDPKWRTWLKALPIAAEFQHKDDTPHRDIALPVVLAERDGRFETLLSAEDLNRIGSVDGLIAALEAKL